jgi:hypothetical protein
VKEPLVVALISCTKDKHEGRMPAGELYTKSWNFRKAVEYATRVLGIKRWAILSAKHGLVMPDRVIAPYDLTLSKMNSAEQRAWAEKTKRQIRKAFPGGTHFVVLASAPYVEGVPTDDYSYDLPLKGLFSGQRRGFLGRHTS